MVQHMSNIKVKLYMERMMKYISANSSAINVGMAYNKGKTPGKMVFQELIVRFLPVGTGHISFRSKIRLEASFTSLL